MEKSHLLFNPYKEEPFCILILIVGWSNIFNFSIYLSIFCVYTYLSIQTSISIYLFMENNFLLHIIVWDTINIIDNYGILSLFSFSTYKLSKIS